jgi:uncharacterized DUF497 family protein
VEFEWDLRKSSLNLRKHGIAFKDVVALFEKPCLEKPDDRHDYGEDRFHVYGELRGRVIVVVYTWRGPKRRILSARRAKKEEREDYYTTIHA